MPQSPKPPTMMVLAKRRIESATAVRGLSVVPVRLDVGDRVGGVGVDLVGGGTRRERPRQRTSPYTPDKSIHDMWAKPLSVAAHVKRADTSAAC